MMSKHGARILLLAAAFFAGSFFATVATRSQPTGRPIVRRRPPVARWLSLSPEQAEQLRTTDPTFPDELAAMRGDLDDARLALATALESESVTDDELRTRLEAVLETHNRLERRVIEHLISVRDQLAPEQRSKLFRLGADGVRRSRQQRWQHREDRRGDRDRDDRFRRGRGRGRGQGPRRGRGD